MLVYQRVQFMKMSPSPHFFSSNKSLTPRLARLRFQAFQDLWVPTQEALLGNGQQLTPHVPWSRWGNPWINPDWLRGHWGVALLDYHSNRGIEEIPLVLHLFFNPVPRRSKMIYTKVILGVHTKGCTWMYCNFEIPGLVMTLPVRHGISMALIEIDGLPFLKMVDLSMAMLNSQRVYWGDGTTARMSPQVLAWKTRRKLRSAESREEISLKISPVVKWGFPA